MIRLACATVSFDGFDDTGFARSFQMMPEVGFKYVEFNCWFGRNYTAAGVDAIRTRSAAAGLVPTGIYGPQFGGNMAKDVGHKMRMLEMAAELECGRIVATGPPRDEPGGFPQLIATLNELAPAAESLGLDICLESHVNSLFETVDDYLRILEGVPSRRVGVCNDIGHTHAAGVDMDEFIERLFARTNHIHLKENMKSGTKKFTRFGEGESDNAGVVDKYVRRGYSGAIVVELSPEAYGLGMGSRKAFAEVFEIEAVRAAKRMFERFATE